MDVIASLVSLINLAVKAAPEVEQVYNDGKVLIGAFFSKGQITQQQQADLMNWAEAHQAAVLAGNEPPEFQVQ